jgi:hypothetical protein
MYRVYVLCMVLTLIVYASVFRYVYDIVLHLLYVLG